MEIILLMARNTHANVVTELWQIGFEKCVHETVVAGLYFCKIRSSCHVIVHRFSQEPRSSAVRF